MLPFKFQIYLVELNLGKLNCTRKAVFSDVNFSGMLLNRLFLYLTDWYKHLRGDKTVCDLAE